MLRSLRLSGGKSPRALLATLLVSAAVSAQGTTTVPLGTASAEQAGVWVASGPSLPGAASGRLHQVLYGAAEFVGSPTTTWNAIELRADALGYAAGAATVSLSLSSVQLPTMRALSADSAVANRGSDHRQVIAPRAIAFPGVPQRFDGAPQPSLVLPFDRPFAHASTDGLLVELEWNAASPVPLRNFDGFAQDFAGWGGTVAGSGAGCSATGMTNIEIQSTVLGELLLNVSHFDPSLTTGAPSFAVFGTGGGSLPLDAIGAPGCTLWVRFAALEPISAFGGLPLWHRNFYLSYDPNLVGAHIRAQVFVLDSNFNAAGIVAGAGQSILINSAPDPRRARHLIFDPATLRSAVELQSIPVIGLR
ncbi:MAG: hypothetical protein AB7I19_11555 [Planctomycetota bacterium]